MNKRGKFLLRDFEARSLKFAYTEHSLIIPQLILFTSRISSLFSPRTLEIKTEISRRIIPNSSRERTDCRWLTERGIKMKATQAHVLDLHSRSISQSSNAYAYTHSIAHILIFRDGTSKIPFWKGSSSSSYSWVTWNMEPFILKATFVG